MHCLLEEAPHLPLRRASLRLSALLWLCCCSCGPDPELAGRVQGLAYTNDFLKVRFQLPAGWVLKPGKSTEAELRQQVVGTARGEATAPTFRPHILFMAMHPPQRASIVLVLFRGSGTWTPERLDEVIAIGDPGRGRRVPSETRELVLGGQRYTRFAYIRPRGAIDHHQWILVTVKRDYAALYYFTSVDPKQLPGLVRSVFGETKL